MLLLVTMLLFSVVAFAVPLPDSVVVDGNTTLRVFNTKDLTVEEQEFFETIIASPRSVVTLFYSPSAPSATSYCFFMVPDNASLVLSKSSYEDSLEINVSKFVPENAFGFMVFSYDSSSKLYMYDADSSNTGGTYGMGGHLLIAGGQFWNDVSYNFPTLGYNYLADISGTLMIEWNTMDNPSSNWWDGLLSWISDFWTIFINTLKSLFIPSPDFLSDFVDDIKTAFESKLGGLSNLVSSVSNMFDSLKNVSGSTVLTITIPDNQFYHGYKGLTVDVFSFFGSLLSFIRGVFNSILVILTIVVCYRRLINIVER